MSRLLAQLAAVHPGIREKGGEVLGVAPASPDQARRLMGSSVPFQMLLDPGRNLATRMEVGVQSLLAYVLNLLAWLRYVRAFFRHRRQGQLTGHHSDLPGVLIVDENASVLPVRRGTGIADYPPPFQILDEFDQAIEAER